MKTTYSDTELHKFIRDCIELEGGKVEDACEDYFTIKTAQVLSPLKYTYKPAISKEKRIDLIATGTPALNGMLDECLKKGNLCSVKLQGKVPVEDFIKNFFKDSDFSCENCEQITIQAKKINICTKQPKCYHKINNCKVTSINIIKKEPYQLVEFFYSVFFNNKLKKSEELVPLLIDKSGNSIGAPIIDNEELNILDCKIPISVNQFDELQIRANEILDDAIHNKKSIFELQLKKEIDNKIIALEKQLNDEKVQRSISKKWDFNESEWKLKKDAVLSKEKESLSTFVNIKFLNLLIVNTEEITFETRLSNGASIKSSFIVGIDKSIPVNCKSCDKEITEGFGTEDGHYLCSDCIVQSIETGKIYSQKAKLFQDNTTKEFIEKDEGFLCSVCEKQNSTNFKFVCNHDKSDVCYQCFEFCQKCNALYSKKNLKKSSKTEKLYCPNHITKCDYCKENIGTDEIRVCDATGQHVCPCTKFVKCTLCEQEYSARSLKEGKCPACSSLHEEEIKSLISIAIDYDDKFKKTKKWLVGKNKLNEIIISKSLLSDTLLVISKGKVIFDKKISLFNKMRGY